MTKEKVFTLKALSRHDKAIEIAKKQLCISKDPESAEELVRKLQAFDVARKDKSIKITDDEVLQIYKDVTDIDLSTIEEAQLKKYPLYLKNIIAEYRDLFYHAVLITKDNFPSIYTLSQDANFKGGKSTAGFSGFLRATPYYKELNTEVYFVFASEALYKGNKQFQDINIHLYYSATTSLDSHFESHMGIQRVAGVDISKRDFSCELHEFGAKVMMAVNPKISYMITTPVNAMLCIFQNCFDTKGKSADLILNTLPLLDPVQHPVPSQAKMNLALLQNAIDDYRENPNIDVKEKYGIEVACKAYVYVRSNEQNLKARMFYPIEGDMAKYKCGDKTTASWENARQYDWQLELPDGGHVTIPKSVNPDYTTATPNNMKWYFTHGFHDNITSVAVLAKIKSLASLSGDERLPEFHIFNDGKDTLHPIEDASMYLIGEEVTKPFE